MRSGWLWVRMVAMSALVALVVLAAPEDGIGGYVCSSLLVAWLVTGCVIGEFGGRRRRV